MNEGTHPILIADDAASDVALLERVLRKFSLVNPIYTVADGAEAISYLDGEGLYSNREKFPFPSVLFLDLKMPRKDGFAVLDWMRNRHWEFIPLVVVLSRMEDSREISRAYQLGARTYIIKPANPAEIENLLDFFGGYWDFGNGATGLRSATSMAEKEQ